MIPEEFLEKTKRIDEEIEEKNDHRYMYYIIGVLMITMIISMAIPYYYVKEDPKPHYTPTIKEVVPETWEYGNETKSIAEAIDTKGVKVVADKIAALSCNGEKVCQAKAIYNFIINNYDYIADPIGQEYIENPKEFLSKGGGDCESGSITIASLMGAIGIESQIVIIEGHAYNRIRINEAIERYKIDDWIYIDWTCKKCEFGEIPWKNWKEKTRYIEV